MEKQTHTLETPDVDLVYDVAGPLPTADGQPPLLIAGHPMTAEGFFTVAEYFPERTIVVYDPRGVGRSVRKDGRTERSPELHSADLHALITEIGAPVDIFASSGGAVNSLALVAEHPDDVRILVAHEPALAQLLPDREMALAVAKDIHETYERSGNGPAMAKFIALVTFKGEIPADYLDLPAPDPAMFGMSAADDGSRNDPLLGHNMVSSTHYLPDFDAVRAAPARIIVATGSESDGEMAHRGGEAVAERLGQTPVAFPDGHGGFLGGEYGQTGEPDAFAAKLREVLAAAS